MPSKWANSPNSTHNRYYGFQTETIKQNQGQGYAKTIQFITSNSGWAGLLFVFSHPSLSCGNVDWPHSRQCQDAGGMCRGHWPSAVSLRERPHGPMSETHYAAVRAKLNKHCYHQHLGAWAAWAALVSEILWTQDEGPVKEHGSPTETWNEWDQTRNQKVNILSMSFITFYIFVCAYEAVQVQDTFLALSVLFLTMLRQILHGEAFTYKSVHQNLWSALALFEVVNLFCWRILWSMTWSPRLAAWATCKRKTTTRGHPAGISFAWALFQ